MIGLMKIYSVEILSVTMGLWLLWIMVIYSRYILNLRKKNTTQPADPKSEDALQEAAARQQRRRQIQPCGLRRRRDGAGGWEQSAQGRQRQPADGVARDQLWRVCSELEGGGG